MGPLLALVYQKVDNLASLLRESMGTAVGVATKRRESNERKRTRFTTSDLDVSSTIGRASSGNNMESCFHSRD
jgi:hypothetical protein